MYKCSILALYRLDDQGSNPDRGKKDFLSSLCVQTSREAHPTSYLVCNGVLSQE
jgi:hypothetical protein